MNQRIGIIGYGSMGQMIVNKIIESGIYSNSDLYLSNRNSEKIVKLSEKYKGIHICLTTTELVENTDVIFICVKPIDIKSVLQDIESSSNKSAYLVSLNASVLFNQIENICINRRISKIIPSITAEVNLSQTLVCHNAYVSNDDKKCLYKIVNTFGSVIELPEDELGIGSELTSCMPGFISAIFKEICFEAQNHTKISQKQINEMVINTIFATSKYLLSANISFNDIISRVATKGGITEEGVKVIHDNFQNTVKEIFIKTLAKRAITTLNAQMQFGDNK